MKKYLILLGCIMAGSVMAQELMIQELPLEAPAEETDSAVEKAVETPKTEGSLDALYTQLEAQSVALRELTERVEQYEHQQQEMKEKLDRVNEDISFRLNELETKAANPVMIDKSSDKERYDFAYELLKKENYAEAEKQFLSFLTDFEKSDLRPNAIYWLGETYYVQAKYEQAVGQFADVFQKYPQSNKAPDALLKMGLSMASLKKNTEACTAFKALPNEYPKAEKALKERAEQEAKKYQCS
ncbi:MAG: tol-pal system protein YbgF [Alphaproteobacteria bacterium]|nr:tol-pal system protein YbgF [Alphaproteobacteria bacterium]